MCKVKLSNLLNLSDALLLGTVLFSVGTPIVILTGISLAEAE